MAQPVRSTPYGLILARPCLTWVQARHRRVQQLSRARLSATPPPPTYSSVTFTGNPQIPATKGTVPFQLGSISYTNGTSNLGTGLLGAALIPTPMMPFSAMFRLVR